MKKTRKMVNLTDNKEVMELFGQLFPGFPKNEVKDGVKIRDTEGVAGTGSDSQLAKHPPKA